MSPTATPSKPVASETLLAQLEWRYAVKKFDATKTIPAADWTALEEAMVLTPSSYGLQPWRFVVVTDPAVKRQIADYVVEEQRRRAKLKMKVPTPNYRGLETAPGFIGFQFIALNRDGAGRRCSRSASICAMRFASSGKSPARIALSEGKPNSAI